MKKASLLAILILPILGMIGASKSVADDDCVERSTPANQQYELCDEVTPIEVFDPETSEDEGSKDGKPSRKFLKDEVIACAKQLGATPGFNLLMINSESKFVSTGLAKEIADAAMGKYHLIQGADAGAIAGVTSNALNQIKNG